MKREKVCLDAQVLEARCHTKRVSTFLGDGAAVSSLVGSAAATTCRRLSQVTRPICPGAMTAGEQSNMATVIWWQNTYRSSLWRHYWRWEVKFIFLFHIRKGRFEYPGIRNITFFKFWHILSSTEHWFYQLPPSLQSHLYYYSFLQFNQTIKWWTWLLKKRTAMKNNFTEQTDGQFWAECIARHL